MRIRLITIALLFCALTAGAQTAFEYNEMGLKAYDAGKFSEAASYFENALLTEPDREVLKTNYANALRQLANQYAEKGNYPKAISLLRGVMDKLPEEAGPNVQLGSYYLQLGEVKEAINWLEKAIDIQPGFLDAHESLGQAYYQDNDLPNARIQWDYVLKMEPERPGLQERYDKAFREESVEYAFNQKSTRNFNITFPPELPQDIRRNVQNYLEDAYKEVGREMGGVYPPTPIQVILYSAEEFSAATQIRDGVGALYDGKIRCPITEKAGELLADSELERRLRHEYSHVVVRKLAGPKTPWWVNEGFAQLLSESFDARDVRYLKKAYTEGVIMPMKQLEQHQLLLDQKPGTLTLAYTQGHAAMHLLWEAKGRPSMVRLFKSLASGKPMEESMRRIYMMSYDQLDRKLAETYQ